MPRPAPRTRLMTFAWAVLTTVQSTKHALGLWAYWYEIKVWGIVAAQIEDLPAPDLLPALEEVTHAKPQRFALALVAATRMAGRDLLRPSTVLELQAAFDLPHTSAQKLVLFCEALAAGEFDPSCEHQIYVEMNRAMRAAALRPEELEALRPLLYHITRALEGLPSCNSMVYQGVDLHIDISQYVTGRHLVWPAFSSTSTDAAVGKQFLGSASCGVLFVIHCRTGKAIESFSKYPQEKVPLPTRLRAWRFGCISMSMCPWCACVPGRSLACICLCS